MTMARVGQRDLSLVHVVGMLRTHLAAVVGVEFFTIPVYLTAVYSFSSKALAYAVGDEQPLFDMQQRLLSVAVQEMYHMQLAANLCNALGDAPVIKPFSLPAGQKISVPHLIDVSIDQLGNAPAMIDAMIAIERPDPDHEYPEPNEDATYSSIADLYHATVELLGIVHKASQESPNASDIPPFDGGKQVSYGTFDYTYQWNTIPQRAQQGQPPPTPIESAVKAVNAITDQGEGKLVINAPRIRALLGKLMKATAPDEVQSEFQPKKGTRFYKYGMFSHETRFDQVKDSIASTDFQTWDAAIRAEYQAAGFDNIGVFYPGDGKVIRCDLPEGFLYKANDVSESINVLWASATDLLRSGFHTGQLSTEYPPDADATFNDVMMSFKYSLPLIWQFGVVPSFDGTVPIIGRLQQAFDVVDPYCIVHWDTITLDLRRNTSFVQNVCQGLNTCKGRGWGGTGQQQGGGDCACCTADLHSCGGGNTCSARGACGYLSTDTGNNLLDPQYQWIPGLNSCKGQGGCQTPIALNQVFDSDQIATIESQTGTAWTAEAKQKLEALAQGTPRLGVWEHARALHNWSNVPPPRPPQPPDAKVDYDGAKRRALVQATVVT